MNTITKVLLVIWILIVLDSSGSILCKFSQTCLDFVKKFSVLARFALKDSNWPYVYFILAVLGLATVLIVNRQQKDTYTKDDPRQTRTLF